MVIEPEDDERRKQRELFDAMRRDIWTPPPDAPEAVTMLRYIRGYEDAITDGLRPVDHESGR